MKNMWHYFTRQTKHSWQVYIAFNRKYKQKES